MGDIDRSPRMMNHALSIAKLTNYQADLIGYEGHSLPEAIEKNPNIRVRYLSTKVIDKLRSLPKSLYLLYAILRILIQIIQMIYVLSTSYEYVLVQNPPCIPLLFICVFMKMIKCRKMKLIIDWHNYGYSILRVNRVNKWLVFLGKIYEMKLGKYGDYHLCVSKAMQTDLQN